LEETLKYASKCSSDKISHVFYSGVAPMCSTIYPLSDVIINALLR